MRKPVAGEALGQFLAGQHLVGQLVLEAGLQRAFEHPTVGWPGVDRSGDVQEPLASPGLDASPQLVGPLQEYHVGRVLVVGQADDARVPMRGPHRVRDVVALQPEYPLATARELVKGRTAHRTDA
jgi:hypothetical protein